MSDMKKDNKREVIDEEIKLSPEILEKIRDIDMDYALEVSLFKIMAQEESRQKSRKGTASPRYKNGEYRSPEGLKDRKSEEYNSCLQIRKP